MLNIYTHINEQLALHAVYCKSFCGESRSGKIASLVKELEASTAGDRVQLVTEYSWRPSTAGDRVQLATEYSWRPSTAGDRVQLATEYSWRPSTTGDRVQLATEYSW